jgi:hypothetical protein
MRYAPRVRYAHLVGMTSEVNYKAVLCVAEIFERAKSKILRREANFVGAVHARMGRRPLTRVGETEK